MRDIDQHAAAVREFNRFYTRRIGVLGESHLGSPFSLTDVRVLYELAHRDQLTASQIAADLGLDRGYLSRTLRAFKKRGLVATTPHPSDRRHTLLKLTAAGRRAFAPVEKRTRERIVAMLDPLEAGAQRQIVQAMRSIRAVLDSASSPESTEPFVLRPHRPGDMGWVIHRHGALYAGEYGWDERFEALVARVAADFVDNFDPKRERCWIAERNGQMVGCIFVVAKSKTVAKLRLLLVEPSARGLGLGGRLVDEVIAFAKGAGYKKIVLWTQRELTSARKIYKAKGFELMESERHHSFGASLTSETWERSLR